MQNISAKFPRFVVSPVNHICRATDNGMFDFCSDGISNRVVKLQKARGPKLVYIAFFESDIGPTEYIDLLKPFGLMPCRYCPNFLLGLMQCITERRMPRNLDGKCIVAAEPNEHTSMFSNNGDGPRFLFVYRKNARRELRLTVTDRYWPPAWAFLAEAL